MCAEEAASPWGGSLLGLTQVFHGVFVLLLDTYDNSPSGAEVTGKIKSTQLWARFIFMWRWAELNRRAMKCC